MLLLGGMGVLMSDKNPSVVQEDVAARFLELVADVDLGTYSNGIRKTRRRTSQEFGEAMVYLGDSGMAGELLEDEQINVEYNFAYAQVFGPYFRTEWNQRPVEGGSFEMRVYDSLPEPYKEWRHEWGQLPIIAARGADNEDDNGNNADK